MVTQGRTSFSRSIEAKLVSPTPMMRRSGSQRAAWIRICLPQSVSFILSVSLLVVSPITLRGGQHRQER